MPKWEKSEAYYDVVGFINSISQSIQGRENTDRINLSPIAENILQIFDKLEKILSETPPIDQPQRFGNKSFRDWFLKMQTNALTYLQEALPESLHRAVPEIVTYLIESFGNSTRIDYGTGHELSFIMFLCCLFKIGALKETDKNAASLKVIDQLFC